MIDNRNTSAIQRDASSHAVDQIIRYFTIFSSSIAVIIAASAIELLFFSSVEFRRMHYLTNYFFISQDIFYIIAYLFFIIIATFFLKKIINTSV